MINKNFLIFLYLLIFPLISQLYLFGLPVDSFLLFAISSLLMLLNGNLNFKGFQRDALLYFVSYLLLILIQIFVVPNFSLKIALREFQILCFMIVSINLIERKQYIYIGLCISSLIISLIGILQYIELPIIINLINSFFDYGYFNHNTPYEYFISNDLDLNPKDRWGGTPLSDAKSHDHKQVVNLLEKAIKKTKGGNS